MGDDIDRDDHSIGPDHLPGPDVGATITFDFEGHPQSVDIDVPFTAEGSDPAHIDFGGADHATPPGLGWMPSIVDPSAPVVDGLTLSPPEGWHRDPMTGVLSPDLHIAPEPDGGWPASDLGPGDFPAPDPDESPA